MRLVAATISIGLMGAAPAFATDCAAPYSIENLLGDLTGVETGLRGGDDTTAAAAGLKLRDGLACLDEVLPAMIAARTYRAVGGGLYVGGDKEGANQWFRTSLELEPTWIYGIQDLSVEHRIRADFRDIKDEDSPDPTPVEGKDFPAESKHYLDGRKLSTPKARLNRFHVFQAGVEDKISTYTIEGNAFPDEMLIEAEVAAPVKEPKVKKPKKDKVAKGGAGKDPKTPKKVKPKKAKAPKTKIGPNGEVIYKRQRPKEKTPLMIAGGGVVIGAGVIYYLASRSQAKFNAIQTAADVNSGFSLGSKIDLCASGQDPDSTGCIKDPSREAERLAGTTNRLVAASLAVLGIGVGVFTTGAIIDGDTIIPTVNVRW